MKVSIKSQTEIKRPEKSHTDYTKARNEAKLYLWFAVLLSEKAPKVSCCK